ncbi:MAG: inner membrane protein [Myxococcota bacterium]|jgi:inner membrane protein
MDPLSQGAVGAAAALIVARPEHARTAALVGALSGMAPDLDVFIRSSTDPLLFLEYHRQFTHSLLFIPVGALICALLARPLLRCEITSRTIYGFCFIGYGSHGLLDACTSYGTRLFWPISDFRVAWNNVSVVDPSFTLPLLIAVGVATYKAKPRIAQLAGVCAVAYLLLGVAQRERAETMGGELAASRGHTPNQVDAKPAFGSLLLWKTLYEHEGRIYVDAVRLALQAKPFPGQSVERLNLQRDFPWLAEESQQARDVQRFRWFSSDQLATDPSQNNRIIDVRYSMVPNRVEALWGIELDQNAGPAAHVKFVTSRKPSDEQRSEMLRMLID